MSLSKSKQKQNKAKQSKANKQTKNICWNYYWDFINNNYAISSGQLCQLYRVL